MMVFIRKYKVQKEETIIHYNLNPIYSFFRESGSILKNDFLNFNNMIAVNLNNIDTFGFQIPIFEPTNFVKIYAVFRDGSAIAVERESKEKILNQNGLQSYIDLLKKQNKYNPKYSLEHNDFTDILHYWIKSDDDTYVISWLQNKSSVLSKKKDKKRILILLN